MAEITVVCTNPVLLDCKKGSEKQFSSQIVNQGETVTVDGRVSWEENLLVECGDLKFKADKQQPKQESKPAEQK